MSQRLLIYSQRRSSNNEIASFLTNPFIATVMWPCFRGGSAAHFVQQGAGGWPLRSRQLL